ncbi:hypothetical protein EV193_101204 [Herbihabitans rhizosphaerae]|uniref:Uncharacterized protein n=1 Tax=Herbihabitans rhizosphaerae TaxID=1872711 RepID=A0A4Q7L3Y3_9PSEU|nr:hypothetical protein [Herbihabitans rhizosphaerae]RZS44329.1 hypothetical protein EV193_101204 [Herbihabitans rhizosphaerae]
MNENELRNGLRAAMSGEAPPATLTGEIVVERARRARRRRQATLAGAGSAAAVALIAVGAVVLPGMSSGEPSGQIGVGARPTSVSPTPTPGRPSSGSTKPSTSWPNGQTDRTARSGPEYDRGARVLEVLTMLRPPGHTAPPDAAGLTYHQANFEDRVNDRETWSYLSYLPVAKDGGVGRLLAEVHTPGTRSNSGNGCELAKKFWGVGGQCRVVQVGGASVGVVTDSADSRIDQVAAVRRADDTAVFVAQAKSWEQTGKPPLRELPFTPEALAAAAIDPRFDVS